MTDGRTRLPMRQLWLPMGLWVATSSLLVWISLHHESAEIAAGLYIGLNGLVLVLTWWREPPVPPIAMKAMAWCTAAQLPTMVVLLLDSDANRTPGAPPKPRFFDRGRARGLRRESRREHK